MMKLEDLYVKIGISLAAVVVVFAVREISRIIIRKHATKHELDDSQRIYANKFFNFTLSIILFILLGIIWDISVKGLSVYFASVFAVVGVALFAQWSIISNITASIILFFNSPFKIGSRIRIMDKDDSVEGKVHDITFFNIHIETDEGTIISYPNNLALQRPIVLMSDAKRS
jgi:MscS family membrane protein